MTYYNDYSDIIGYDAERVNEWLAAHPNYKGCIYANEGDGSDDMDVTDIFIFADEEVA